MDVLGPLPTSSHGNRYLLVLTDCFTMWVEAFPLKSIRAKVVAEVFANQVISRYGIPLELHTDQGSNFESKLFLEITQLLGIRKIRTTQLNLQSNGHVERQHQTLLNYLAKFVSKNQKDWDQWISLDLLAYRSFKNEATNFSPSELFLGRELRLSLDLLCGHPPDSDDIHSGGGGIISIV